MRIFLLLVMFLAVPALAQQQAPMCQTGAADERVRCMIGDMLTQNISLATQVQQLRAALKDAQDQTKALKDKYEPAAKPQ